MTDETTPPDAPVEEGVPEAQLVRLREALIGGGSAGHGMGLKIFLALTGPADPLRPELEAKVTLAERVLADPTTTLTDEEQELLDSMVA